MSPDAGKPGKPQSANKLEINPADNFYVLAVKTLMNKEGISLEEATERLKLEAAKSPSDEGEFLKELELAVNSIKLEQGKKS